MDVDLGHSLSENEIKRGLRELNSDIHFDLGGKHDITHPMMNIWQGVFHKGRHITSMSRGQIPEYDVYALGDQWDPGQKKMVKVRKRIIRVGWRTTFEKLIHAGIHGVTRESIAAKFKVPIKFFTGERSAIEVSK